MVHSSHGMLHNNENGQSEGDLTLGGEHTTQHTNKVLQNCTPQTYVILLTNVTPINSIKFLKKKMKRLQTQSCTAHKDILVNDESHIIPVI